MMMRTTTIRFINHRDKTLVMKQHPEYDNLLQFENLNKHGSVEHFITTRNGGVSNGEFSTFNLGNFSDDNPIDIHENREILSRMWYMDIVDFIVPHQTHSSNVLVIDEDFQSMAPSDKIDALYGVDATITHLKNIFLCATTADCVPILLLDTKKDVIAAVHAGWRGIVDNIIENTVRKMNEIYQSDNSDIVAAIGPSISMKHYEIGTDVVAKLKGAGLELNGASFFNGKNNKLHINLKQIAHDKLVNLGILSEKIEKTDLCTFENTELFFSARRQSIHCGRMLSGIKLID